VDDALRNHTLLSEKEFQPALTPEKLADGSEPTGQEPTTTICIPAKPVAYGFGPGSRSISGTPADVAHGNTMGFRTVIERFTDSSG